LATAHRGPMCVAIPRCILHAPRAARSPSRFSQICRTLRCCWARRAPGTKPRNKAKQCRVPCTAQPREVAVKEADDHRKRAAFCISLAATTDDEVTKGALIEMAQKWRELANRFDLAEPPPSPRGTMTMSWLRKSRARDGSRPLRPVDRPSPG